MTASEYWRDMESRFQQFPDPERKLLAEWVLDENQETIWTISGIDDSEILDSFRELVADAGGNASSYSALRGPIVSWLGLLWHEIEPNHERILNVDSGASTNGIANGADKTHGVIQRVCEISARYCGDLAYVANEAEQRVLAEKASEVDWRARTRPYRESGKGSPADWRRLRVDFLELPNGRHIYALASSPYEKHWTLGRRGNLDGKEWDRLLDSFEDLARQGAIKLGYRTGDDAWLDWLDCLRAESPLFSPFDTPRSGYIDAPYLIQACADECVKLETRALAREAAMEQEAAKLPSSPNTTPRCGPLFPQRAAWLRERLHERSWNKHDLERQCGPSYKTTQKILDGCHVREDALNKVAIGLSKHQNKKLPPVAATDIPKN